MATAAQWVEGARPRTLPAAVAPVAVGTGAAVHVDGAVWWRAGVCLVVALALQVGVNYANDYSDGVRGTDADRVGPLRLVGSGAAAPAAVKRAALASFAVAAVAGLALVVASGAWALLLVGAACIAAAWYYTGGSRPYGYSGLGEVSVFVFFGLVATVGTNYVQTLDLHAAEVLGGVGCGALACAVLVANNLRDIPTDAVAGKRTLAVLLGDTRTRVLYAALVAVAALVVLAAGVLSPWSLLGLVPFALAVRPVRAVLAGASGRDLVPVLGGTGRLLLAYGLLLGLGLALG
ncbi:1,4-dihydroxy-2-naphthoate polyprenyltransferase [Vallicoccus soli]|uniref:1,4-dihydroxy-2-naphthoate octaprenyltransferase n=1 Tax=Vallicoccus soli TaxID=2339232 RepID=A0A3A3YZ91_9ACTN|nr:1,4-dihydroxy-2-naphthoate polyprenyltransferase [Vallicoccus soli]RJK93380.1 1,4-dihydroxy-2-naphthoate polyprenyltransferase [Vallicoccus soli]